MVAVSQLNHPRMCGEKWMYPCSQIRSLGSPPRMRGKETGSGIKTQKTRITPAYAGKSKRIAPSSVLFGDHPRVCGEKESARPARHAAWGSPPRMRGKEVGKHVLLCSGRITPAYAGKRGRTALTTMCRRDHPRVCGEKYAQGKAKDEEVGSPPRMRGKVSQFVNLFGGDGITPAYAGKSGLPLKVCKYKEDHPRVCGEKIVFRFSYPCVTGSPPRMRGKVSSSVVSPVSMRITPAYAGKSLQVRSQARRLQDHPRVCGEKPALTR